MNAPAAQPSGGRLADATTAASARRAANRRRSEFLASVALGYLSVHDVVASACTADGGPLLRVSLTQLLGAQPHWGRSRVRGAVQRLLTLLGEPDTDPATLNVAWLVDPRVKGARLIAFADATSPAGPTQPWPGFPMSPAPAHHNPARQDARP